MKKSKRIISFFMVLVLAVLACVPAYATDTYRNKYPMIFVHGMFGWGLGEGINNVAPYWGATTGSLMEYLNDNGIEAYDVSVGPISSAWDNACEIYAQLTGTRVDYGEAHSKEHNHSRYGREYTEPLIEKWDENNKIHLIGHSHGGQAVRLLTHLLTYGDKTEVEASGKENVSALFTGGKEYLVDSVTTICCPNNGTTAYDAGYGLYILPIMERIVCLYIGIMGRSFLNGKLVDFHLEQYGLTYVPGEKEADNMFDAIDRFRNSGDNVSVDLSHEGAYELNQMIKTSENVKYFCYTADLTSEDLKLPQNYDFFFLAMTSMLLRFYPLPEDGYGIEYDDSWLSNDGLVNTVSGKNPYDEPAKEYDGNVEPGVWNIMPTIIGDHGTPIGLFSDKDELHAFYDEFTEMLISVES